MDLRQIHMEDVFGPSLGQIWRSRSPRTQKGIFWPFWRPVHAVYVW